MSHLQPLHLLPPSRPGTPRLGSSRPSSPVSRPRTPLFGGFQNEDGLPGWQTKGSIITQALPIGRFGRWKFRIYLAFFIITLALVIAHAVRLNPRIVYKIWQPSAPDPYSLQVLIPAASSSLGLCKTLFTAAILNYPTPTLINWGNNFTDESLPDGGEEFAKHHRIVEYITRLRENQKDDLVLVVDAEDVWFQLRPSTLVERYHHSLKESNRLTKQRMGNAMGQEHIKQTTIFGSRKTCVPNAYDDIGCYPQPLSPLSDEMYGANTDTDRGHTDRSSFRPRFVDSGIVMAPAEDIRQIMVRARSKHEEKQRGPGGSDQSIFNTIVGQQEFQRQVMHERWLSLMERFKRAMGHRKPSILDPHPTHEHMDHLKSRTHDFGIGLDYSSAISHQTSDAVWDGRFIKYNEDKNVDTDHFDCIPQVKDHLPYDISSSYVTSVRVRHEVLQNKTWGDLPLYTNMCTGVIPVILNHQGDHEERDELWEQFWMQPMAKNLFKEQHRRANLESPEDFGIDIGINSGGAKLVTGEKLSWEEMCSEHEPALFGTDPG